MSKPIDDAMSLQWVRNAVIAACRRTERSREMIDDVTSEVATRILVARRDGKFINLGLLVRWVMADHWRKERTWYERHVQNDPFLAELLCSRSVRIPTVEPIDGVVMDMKRVVEQLPDDSKALVFSRARSFRGRNGERRSRLSRRLRDTLEAA